MRRLLATLIAATIILAGCGGSSGGASPSTTQANGAMIGWYLTNADAVKEYIAVFDGIVAKRSEADPAYTCYHAQDWPAWALDPVPDRRLDVRLSDAIVSGEHTYDHCQAGWGGVGNPNNDLTYSDIKRAGDRIRVVLDEIADEAGMNDG